MGYKTRECTVLMSTYNGHDFVRPQIDSILNQTDVNVKLYIRDDGSTDDTVLILEDYKHSYPNQITIDRGHNVGIHGSFADLICKVDPQGYVAFADQDDVWDRDKLIIAISYLEQGKADFYSSASRLVDSNLNDLGRTTASKAEHYHYMNTASKVLTPGTQGCTIVMTNTFFHKLVSKGVPSCYGHDTWITVIAYYTVKCVYDEVAHMSYRQHNKSWTGNRNHKYNQLKKNIKFFFAGMKRYVPLACDVMDKYGDDIGQNDKKVLSLLSKKNKTVIDRIKLICNPNFKKFGFMKNFIFKVEILIGRV